jgi:hypothetical protein
MNINVNQPSFISLLNQLTNNILSNVDLKNYFSLTPQKKLSVSYVVLKLLKTALKPRAKLSDQELKFIINVLLKKNEEKDNFEVAAVLNDIFTNFDVINEQTIPKKRIVKQTNNIQINEVDESC